MKQNRKPGIHLHKTTVIKPVTKPAKTFKHRVASHVKRVVVATKVSEYYWILISKNGKTIARSSETYKRKGSAVKSIEVAATIFLGGRPYELIPYYDHTGKNGIELVEF